MIDDHRALRTVSAIGSSLAIIWLGVVAFIVVLLIILRFVVLRSFVELERQNTLENLYRVLNAIAEEKEDLNAKSTDWAAWDDAYRFVEDRNEAFIHSNFVLSAFTGVGINLIAYTDVAGEIVYARWHDPGSDTVVPIPEDVRRALYSDDLLFRHPDVDHAYYGSVMTERGPMLLASRPVVTSREQGPIRGSLIFGELLDSERVQKLSRVTRVSARIERLDRDLPPDFARARREISESRQALVRPIGRNVVAGYTILDDVRGEQILMLRITRPRTLVSRGRALSDLMFVAVTILAILFAMIATLLIIRTARRECEYESRTREFYRRTIEAATEGKLMITDREEICRRAGAPIAAWDVTMPEEVSGIRHEIREVAGTHGLEDSERADYFVLAAGEALTNALKHAGGGRATMHKLPDGLMLVVADKGPGIPSLALPDVALTRGYSTAGTLGMGYKFMISMTDCVLLCTGPEGTTVGLVIGLHPDGEPSGGASAARTS